MVTIRLCGGTGNQLWQRAFGYALEALGNEVVFDRSYFDNCDARAYTLDRFSTQVVFGKACGQEITEPDLTYHPEFLKKYDTDVTLSGYWQCPRYIEGGEDQIRDAFWITRWPSVKSIEVSRAITRSNSVFVHIRRTDSLAARGQAFHGVCSGEYYGRAISHVISRVQDPHFFIFSDDIEWCKKNVQEFGHPITFVDHNTTGVEVLPDNEVRKTDNGTEEQDLWLMSKCKHGICANSSFGWWANWLGQPGIRIAPQEWFTEKWNHLSKDMIPDAWLRI